MLLLTALVWGCAFVAQRTGMETIGPFAFNGLRFWLGALSLFPVLYMNRRKDKETYAAPPKGLTLVTASAILGFFLFSGSSLQQVGLIYTTAGKAGFITSLYIVAVPLIGLLMKNTLRLAHILGCLIAVSGLYLLAFHGSGDAVNFGDLLNLIGVVFWSLHILFIDRFVPYFSGIKLAVGQFIACGCYNFIAMPFYGETLTLAMIVASAVPILYCGILSSGVVFWSLHILFIDRFVPYFSGIKLAVGQFIACGCYNFIAMPFYGETLTLAMIVASAVPILYCGILSSGVGYTLQIVAQRKVPPTEASLLCSFEMIFGALAGVLLLGEWMSMREFMGCVLMTIGIFSAQIPSRAILQFRKNLSY